MAEEKNDQAQWSTDLGAVCQEKGVAFRVWAPNANKVFVMGDFNDWSETADSLKSEQNGFWSGKVAKAKVGDEYKFLIVNGEQKLARIDPYARVVTNSVGNGVIYDPDAFDWSDDDFEISNWSELIIYEMHVGTFNDDPGGAPGNFKRATKKLPYLSKLGINVVQIMPPSEFPGGFSWGYNPSHIFAVESDYGGPDAFKAFIKRAHELGIAVVLDVVYNHFGPSDLDLWQFDGWSENDGGGIYFYNDWRSETEWGHTRPDYGRSEVRQFLLDNALMWLTEYRLDGLRWDATAYIRNAHGNDNDPANDISQGWELMQWINAEAKARFPQKLMIAEDLRKNAWLVLSDADGGANFGAQWDGEFIHSLRPALISNDDTFRDMGQVQYALSHRYGTDAFKRVIYTESHDEVANGKARIPQEITPDDPTSWFAKKRSTLGAVLTLTAPGIPMLFQGQEFLEDEWFKDDTPLDWDMQEDYIGIVRLYHDLIHLRRNLDGSTAGLTGQNINVTHVDHENKLIAYSRWLNGDDAPVVVIANFSNRHYESYGLALPFEGEWRVRFNSDSSQYDDDFGNIGSETVATTANENGTAVAHVEIAPYSALILTSQT